MCMEIVKGSLWTDVGPTHGSSVVKKVAGGMGIVGAIPRLGPLWGSVPHTISNLELAHPLHVGALVSTTYLPRGHPFLEFISNSVGPQKSKHSSWVHRIR